eukprot:scaffold5.g714.t1
MAPTHVRTLHWVFKTADRTSAVDFLHSTLGMHALRHEEFAEGCAAACNGPYDGRWSKASWAGRRDEACIADASAVPGHCCAWPSASGSSTALIYSSFVQTMLGYGDEDHNCVLELTYNYTVRHYQPSNDLQYIKIKSRSVFKTLMDKELGHDVELHLREVKAPEGWTFRVVNDDPNPDVGPIASLALNVSSLARAEAFWIDTLGFLEVDRGADYIVCTTGPSAATLRLTQLPLGQALSRGTGYGRIAFSCPAEQLAGLQEEVAASNAGSVVTPLLSLDTPGKATVQVVILADSDGHEVCFVGDEAFRRGAGRAGGARELSRVDELAQQKLAESIAKDESSEWFVKQEARKQAAAAAAGTTATPAAAVPRAGNAGKAAPTVPAAAAAAAAPPAAEATQAAPAQQPAAAGGKAAGK